MKIKQKINGGFTLIELLVVVSIIGVLTALLLANFVGIRTRAKDTSLKNGLNQLKTSMRLYYNDNQSYPLESAGSTFASCGGVACSAEDEFNSLSGTIYMKSVPEYTEYNSTNGGDGFTVGVLLNNPSDSDIADSVTNCGISPVTPNTFYVCAD